MRDILGLQCIQSSKRPNFSDYVSCVTYFTVFTLNMQTSFIAPDKALSFQPKSKHISSFSTKTYVMGTDQKCLTEALLISSHNICFCGEMKLLCGYQSYLKLWPLLLTLLLLTLKNNCQENLLLKMSSVYVIC